jgi:hypothetical protein
MGSVRIDGWVAEDVECVEVDVDSEVRPWLHSDDGCDEVRVGVAPGVELVFGSWAACAVWLGRLNSAAELERFVQEG